MTINRILKTLEGVRPAGNGQWAAKCPAHDDRRASLSVGVGDGGRAVLHCHAGCSTSDIVRAVGLEMSDLFPGPNGTPSTTRKTGPRRIVATYDYSDEHGELLYQVCRYDPKDFRQRRPDGKGGWTWRLDGVRRVLYRLPELLNAPTGSWVFICEGEKDADALAGLGLVATTNAGGAGKWNTLSDDSALHGRPVAILPDNDEPGRRHAADVAQRLHGKASDVRIVELPGLPDKGDVCDWLRAGGTAADLLDLVEAAEPYTPTIEPPAPEAPEYAPFPVHLLPDPLGRFVSEGARAFIVDESFFAQPVLAVCAGLIGNSRRVVIKPQWLEPPTLWMAAIGASGTGKTPPLKEVLRPARTIQRRMFKDYEKALADFQRVKAEHEKNVQIWRQNRQAQGGPPEEPKAPVCPRLIVQDTTLEALGPILKANPRGVLIVRDELSGWLRSFDRYQQRGKGDAATWLELFSGESVTIDRKGGTPPVVHIPSATVSILGGVQPGVLNRAIASEHRENGLLARLLLCYPPRRPKRWTDAAISRATEIDWTDLVDCLARFEMDIDANGDPTPRLVQLSPEARRAFIDFYNTHNNEMAGLDEDLCRAFSKLEAYACRFALVFHEVLVATGQTDTPGMIDLPTMAAAIELTRWWANETRRVYTLLESDGEDGERAALVRIVQRLGGRVTVRQVQQTNRKRFPTAEDAERALLDLAADGLGTWTFNAHNGGPGRGVQVFELTPRLGLQHKCQKLKESGDSVCVVLCDNPQVQPEPSQTPEATADPYTPPDTGCLAGPVVDISEAPPGWEDSDIDPDLLGDEIPTGEGVLEL